MSKEYSPFSHFNRVLWNAHKVLTDSCLRSLNSFGLNSYSEYAILETLQQEGSQPVNTIGRKVMLTSGSITAALDRLEKRGWLERKPSPEDRRVVEVHLTAKGRNVAVKAVKRHEEALAELMREITPTELNRYSDLLAQLVSRASDLKLES